MMDVIDRLRNSVGVFHLDAINDAVAEIERLRRELAARPPDGTAPHATRTEHKRKPSLTLDACLGELFGIVGKEQFADAQEIVRRAYRAGREGETIKTTVPTIMCGNCGCEFPLTATICCSGCGIEEAYGDGDLPETADVFGYEGDHWD